MKVNYKALVKTVAARASSTGTPFYPSYVKNVKCIAIRQDKDWWMAERDYQFTYQSKTYIVSAETVGDKRYSALQSYRVEEVSNNE